MLHKKHGDSTPSEEKAQAEAHLGHQAAPPDANP